MRQPPRTTPEAARPNPIPPIEFAEALPVSARRDDIAAALAAHQAIVVCGETGSGKTTQLPKIALGMGRGRANGGGLIGHTQPRRIAASSVARRIAEELKTPLGEVVGYKVRFQDRLSAGASVKLMTDGILLAETQSDPLLRAYDTIIVDEAHERSLNIDFLLGHLRQIMPRRPDLKIIVTSATIDADRFASHFASKDGPAPVLQVSGRLYPVEIRWRPFVESRDHDLGDAICDAVDELWRGTLGGAGGEGGVAAAGSGDVLVFLPGEREIRDAAEKLRKHHPPGVEVLPLFSRLSQEQQDEVFAPHSARRIVLATNVAETSLTVPGIRYVIDAGTARIKRYSFRSKVEQLPIEAVSQAAANQRAGRCGRVADGICIRLYDEADFAGRPKFTEPEIVRSSLAGVILRMKSLNLGEVEDFPFLEAPPKRAIADGYQLLNELGATDDENALTTIGRELAKLPLDPRVGRMILAARERESLREVLVIASSLSVQDVRDRPLEQQQAADQAHLKFDDEKSEFLGILKLWAWLESSRGGHGEHRLSSRKHEGVLRDNFVSPRRVREWRDVFAQLQQVVTEHGWRVNTTPAIYEQLHLSMLAGLLGNIGQKSDEDDSYLGARGIRFHRHPGSHLSKKPGRWIVAAELVETTRLYARGIANIEPRWLETVGGHLLKKQLLEPHWEKKAGQVVALERATLYGLVVYANRRVDFGTVDPVAAREIFIREALVAGEWETKLPFAAANRRLMAQIEELEHKARRQDVLVDDELIHAFYDQQVPADVHNAQTFERWYREEVRRQPSLLLLTREELMRHEAAGITTQAFPRTIRLGGIDCAATYLHEPGNARDGVTVTLPVYALNAAGEDRCEWLVPGMLKDKLVALAKTLPQRPRSRLVPLPDYAEAFIARHPFADGSLLDVLTADVRATSGIEVRRADFKHEQLAPHLLMNLRVVDEHGRQLGESRHLAELKGSLGSQARSAFQALAALRLPAAGLASPAAPAATAAPGPRRSGDPASARRESAPTSEAAPPPTAAAFTAWTFGELPELMEVKKGGQALIGYPALIDKGAHVEIEVFDEPEAAADRHRAGLRRLFALQLRDAIKYLEKNLPDLQKMAIQYVPLGSGEELREQILAVALDRAFLAEPLPADAAAFARRLEEGRGRLTLIAGEVARAAGAVLAEWLAAQKKLKDARPPKDVADDIAAQLERLVGKRFLVETPWARLAHLPRYLKAVVLRLDKLKADPARDAARLAELRPLEQRHLRKLAERRGSRDVRLDEFRWWLEELRVSLFAQELKTPQPVSAKRLEKIWAQAFA
ncbi:MAG: ATP-dependent RNA helicase HrpA [Burkholderiales bacterium]|nr:ATP-dependent RNA helicase HrpA [Burkholderiales bacterium]